MVHIHDITWDPILPPGFPKNATFWCSDVNVIAGWTINAPATVIISALVICYFLVVCYLNRNAGPAVWNSPYMAIFYGYCSMQFAAIFLWGGLADFIMESDSQIAWILRILWLPLSWGGYWIVGQYLICGPVVDMKCFKWNGAFRQINWVISIASAGLYLYFEYGFKNPMKVPAFNKLQDLSRLLVYIGNVFVLVEVLFKRWAISIQGVLIYAVSAINAFALWFTFTYDKDRHENFSRVQCMYYLLEGLSLIILWKFFIMTRPLLEEYAHNDAGGYHRHRNVQYAI